MSHIYNLIISQPFYNAFIFLIQKLPFLDAGLVVILFTIIIKVILLPLSIKASKSQIEMKSVEKDLNALKIKYKDNKEELSRQTIEYYKTRGINPFAGFFILLIQFPIIIGLYQAFLKSGLPKINTAVLYSFVTAPAVVNMMFLGIINIASKNIFLALLAGLSTYFQISLASKLQQSASTGEQVGTQAEIMKAMSVQMKYIFPVIVVFISYSISSALSLYWITSNIFAIGQEYYIRKKYHKVVTVI